MPTDNTKTLAKEVYDLFWQATSNLHPQIDFNKLPPMYTDAWCLVVEHLRGKIKQEIGISPTEIPITSPKEVNNKIEYEHLGLMAGFNGEQLMFLRKYFPTIKKME